MNIVNFSEKDLPVRDLETLGLAAGGQLLLNVDDLKALLSGRRTGLLELHDLEAENIKIRSINAKISLRTDETGKVDLVIHPVYRKAAKPGFLDDSEAAKLQNGETASLLKITVDDKGNKKELLVEFDADTREFIVSDTDRIMAPDMVNNEFLTPAQKENYRKGKEVELAEGTAFHYSATDEHGIRANKIALVASILIDGGMSYMLYKGLNALFNKERDEQAAGKLSPGYYNGVNDMENQRTFAQGRAGRTADRGGARR